MSSLAHNFNCVRYLADSLITGGKALANVPDAVKAVLKDKAWKNYRTDSGREFHHDSFQAFVTTPPLGGLGCKDVGQLERLCADDPEARLAIQEALKGKAGRPSKDEDKSHDNVMRLKPGQGNSQGYTLDRLKRDHRELFDRVVAGELSANAAAIEAGFRKRMVQVEPTVDGFTKAIHKHLDGDSVDALVESLGHRHA